MKRLDDINLDNTMRIVIVCRSFPSTVFIRLSYLSKHPPIRSMMIYQLKTAYKSITHLLFLTLIVVDTILLNRRCKDLISVRIVQLLFDHHSILAFNYIFKLNCRLYSNVIQLLQLHVCSIESNLFSCQLVRPCTSLSRNGCCLNSVILVVTTPQMIIVLDQLP